MSTHRTVTGYVTGYVTRDNHTTSRVCHTTHTTPHHTYVCSCGLSADNSEPEKDLPKRVGFGFGVSE